MMDDADATPSPQDGLEPGGAGRSPHYRVRLPVFEGPLDLLLHLIKKNEVGIVDIPIAAITEQYLAYLEMMQQLNLDVAGEFLVMAATLTLVKSRMLLPPSEDDIDEEEPDPRAQLVQQLLEYQRYREAALALSERPWLHRDVFTREPTMDAPADAAADVGPPRVQVTMWELLEAFRGILKRAKPESVHEVVIEPVSLRDRIESLLRLLGVARVVEFDSLFDDATTRIEIIVTFLALLELMKMSAVRAVQDERFGRIVVELAVADAATVLLDAVDEYGPAGVVKGEDDGRHP
jgi:segregation and condensation protein A